MFFRLTVFINDTHVSYLVFSPISLCSVITNLKFNFYTRPCGTMQEIELAAVQFYLSE